MRPSRFRLCTGGAVGPGGYGSWVNLGEEEARRRFAASRVARLASVGGDGQPHLVPVTFALRGDVVVSAVDRKPKRSRDLRRLRNIQANPRVALLVDVYDDDWSQLWWVRADGDARVLEREEDRAEPLRWLRARYDQYRADPPDGPVVWVDVGLWRGWAATG